MRFFKTIFSFAVAMLLPVMAAAQKPAAHTGKYPDFDFTEAATLWKQWRAGAQFTPEQYARVMEMCVIGYDYMQADVQAACDRFPDTNDLDKRRKAIADLDQGEYSDIETFCRSFTTRMLNCALEKQLDDENRDRAFLLHKRKIAFRDFLKEAKSPTPKTETEAKE